MRIALYLAAAFMIAIVAVDSARAWDRCEPVGEAVLVCAGDTEAGSDPTCSTPESHGQKLTGAGVATPVAQAAVVGGRGCTNTTEESSDGVAVIASAFWSEGHVEVVWGGMDDHRTGQQGCAIYGGAKHEETGATASTPCPAGLRPPDPGWGDLVP